MVLFVVLAVLLPWSSWLQTHVHPVTQESLIKLPWLFAGVGALMQSGSQIPGGRAVGDVCVTLGLSFAAQTLVVARRTIAHAVKTTVVTA